MFTSSLLGVVSGAYFVDYHALVSCRAFLRPVLSKGTGTCVSSLQQPSCFLSRPLCTVCGWTTQVLRSPWVQPPRVAWSLAHALRMC